MREREKFNWRLTHGGRSVGGGKMVRIARSNFFNPTHSGSKIQAPRSGFGPSDIQHHRKRKKTMLALSCIRMILERERERVQFEVAELRNFNERERVVQTTRVSRRGMVKSASIVRETKQKEAEAFE